MQMLARSFACLMIVFLSFSSPKLFAQEDILPGEAQSEIERIPHAKIKFEATTYDFGVVEAGTIVTQVFTFTNTSEEPLVLIDARGSCGCTVPQWPREPIMPGETASLTVEFNSKNKQGKRNQRVTLTANTEPPQIFLSLTGEVFVPDETELRVHGLELEEPEPELSADCFAIFPNPTAEVLKLEMEKNSLGKSAVISIYSKTGQLMARREIGTVDSVIEFNVAHYPPGTYMANVQIGKQRPQTRCFVVAE